ncbi:universal stress protein [Streptomyces finlayi]|uniref:Universal stress protein n=1 Tax=Streptomyces finlayi TaxID=67296 RepID=A0A7G7BUI4_9ACTN|nr:universal stress protein [Streptomyces finlayi]
MTVGLDGSPESLAATEWAAREAELRGVPLRIVHVREWPVTPEIPLTYSETDLQRADSLLRSAADKAGQDHPGVPVSTDSLPGQAADVLASEAGETATAELVVLGSRGLSGVMGFLIGSVGMAVLGSARRPVVLVRAAPRRVHTADAAAAGRSGDVVLGLDLSRPSDDLLRFAFDEAARRGCTLRVLHAWSLPASYGRAEIIDPDIGLEVGDQVARSLRDTLSPWREKYASTRVSERAVVGAAGPQLVYASADADLVIVGRHVGRVPVGPHLGHVAHAVIHHSAAPVAVVPHG